MGLEPICPKGAGLAPQARARFGTAGSHKNLPSSRARACLRGGRTPRSTSPLVSLQSWDRNQKRRRHSGQQSGGRQQESQQPLADLSPTTVSILGPYSDSLAPTPEAEESRQGQEGMEKLGGHGKSTAFQLNR